MKFVFSIFFPPEGFNVKWSFFASMSFIGNACWEDFELGKHMDALGLPTSFSTTKQVSIWLLAADR